MRGINPGEVWIIDFGINRSPYFFTTQEDLWPFLRFTNR